MHIVHTFLQMAVLIKLYHWNTTSYARHKATDELYAAIQSGMDKFVEVYIGIYGRKEVLNGKCKPIEVIISTDKSACNILDEFARFLHEDVPKSFNGVKHTDLLNIRDEILAHVNQAKYLFTLSC